MTTPVLMSSLRRMRLACPLVALVGLVTGCSAGRGGADGPLGETQEASVCAAGTVVYGVDVSIYQGSVNWADVKAAGKDFAIARISDGTGSIDSTFPTNWAGIKAAGMVRGAYQFFEPGEDPTAQANIVIQKVGMLGDGDLPVTADMEVTGGQSAATIVANLQTWVAAVKAGTGKTPMIYTAEGYWDGSVNSSAFSSLPLWAANWGVSCPNLANGWSGWKFWQNADNGSVSGISGNVDLDQFNGDLAALETFAGGADWGASYVSQSWPLATMTITLTVNQELPASITLKNIGQKSWDSSTKIGTTQPRDRKSAFVGPDWLAPNRLAAASGTVAPGDDFKFQFTFKAPSTPGAYDEFYGVLQEGVAWFSDPGQGGPADNDIEAKFQVNEAQYHGDFVSQTFPTLQDPAIQMTTGQTMDGTITIKNVGTATWKAGVTKLAPTPRDKPSPLGATNWISPTRVSSPPMDVPPGQSYAFPLELTATAPGDYTQTFSLVEESVTWFADAPAGGGPPDNLIAVHVVVDGAGGGTGAGGSTGTGGSPATGTGGEGTGGGTTTTGSSSASGTSSGEPSGAGGGASGGGTDGKAGCSCRMAGEESSPTGGTAGSLFAAAIALIASRRRRSER